MGTQARANDRATRRRKEIVESAKRLFAGKGYQSTQIADIAKDLGIGHGTVYRYFSDKRDVFDAVIGDVVGRISDALAGEAPGADSLEAYAEQVRRIGEALYRLFIEDPDLAQLAFVEAPAADSEIAAQVEGAMEGFAQVTEAYILNGQQKGYLRTDIDSRVVAKAINAMIVGGARAVLASNDPNTTKDVWLSQVPDVFLNGIASR